MRKSFLYLVLAIILGLVSWVAFGQTPADPAARDAAAINRFFADIQLVLQGLKGLVEPLVGLGVAIGIGLQARVLRNQRLATADRAETKQILTKQDDTLATIHSAVAAPPVVVVTSAPESEKTD